MSKTAERFIWLFPWVMLVGVFVLGLILEILPPIIGRIFGWTVWAMSGAAVITGMVRRWQQYERGNKHLTAGGLPGLGNRPGRRRFK
jgi:hypothetical protein